jgi:ubiquinone/menaquinone biosynthesis C-methylase UbiE
LKKSEKISQKYLYAGNHDDIADSYEESVISGYNNNDLIREKYFELLDEVVSIMDYAPGIRILDIGIGTGFLTEKLPKDILSYGIDISAKMLKILKMKKLKVKLKYGSFLDIPFKDKYFDGIISTYAFHHIPYELQPAAFDEMNRVLKYRGLIIIGDLMFKSKRAKRNLRSYFKSQGMDDTVCDIDEEYFAYVKDSTAYLKSIGFTTEYKQISTLSWILKAAKIQ